LRLRAVLGIFNPRTDMSGATNVLADAGNLSSNLLKQ
jgi:hypothetical protein